MNNALGDALQKALDAKKNDYSSFVWKGEKVKSGKRYVQESKRMIDMSNEELQDCYNRCNIMLHNSNPKNPGRYNVLDEIEEQINKCNVELFLRYCENTYKHTERSAIPRGTLRISLRQFMENSNNSLKAENSDEEIDWNNIYITAAIAQQLPDEFKNITIADVMEGCMYCLGAFDKKHLTMTFITKMGLWFTKAEEIEFRNGTTIEKLKTIKSKLHLPEELILKFSDKGLSYHEMKAMLSLPKKQRYSDMTNEQLITLRDKVLFRFQKTVESHIFSWNRLKKQIELVARSKNFELV